MKREIIISVVILLVVIGLFTVFSNMRSSQTSGGIDVVTDNGENLIGEIDNFNTEDSDNMISEDETPADETSTEIINDLNGTDSNDTQDNSNDADSDTETKVFVVDGSSFKFKIDGEENPDIVVQKGDTVRIEFSSSDGFHDWVVDEFNASTERVNTGDSSSVEFIADQEGSFKYYCSVGQHRANGMEGNFIVE